PKISLTQPGHEQHAGAPEGLILIPTTSVVSTNFAQAARTEDSPVSSFIPCSSIWRTMGCETRFRTMDRGSDTSTTRPGYNPGIPRSERFPSGASCTSMGGGSGSLTSSSYASASTPPRNNTALPRDVRFTKVRRSMAPSGPVVCLRTTKAYYHLLLDSQRCSKKVFPPGVTISRLLGRLAKNSSKRKRTPHAE